MDHKTETEIQKEIMDHLKSYSWDVYRMNSGRISGVRLHKKGTPDIMAQKDGVTIWIEVKKPNEIVPDHQLKDHAEKRNNGFKVFVVTSLEELLSHSNQSK
jgi:Holliday junction resolvase